MDFDVLTTCYFAEFSYDESLLCNQEICSSHFPYLSLLLSHVHIHTNTCAYICISTHAHCIHASIHTYNHLHNNIP